jgi:deoxyadenosine/deoxycytidine kinase
LLSKDLVPPDLVIYLNRSPETLRENIVKRGRSYELNIEDSYLFDIQCFYNEWLEGNPKDSFWTIEADRYDFLKNESDLESLIHRITQWKKE